MKKGQSSGFTMVEVITVLVVLGILSATAVGFYQNIGETEFAERLLLKSNLRYARQRAMDSTVNWSVHFSGTSYTLMKDGVSGETFPSTRTGTHIPGITLSGAGQLEFEAQSGALTLASMQTITLENGSTVKVYPTGCIP